MGPQWRGGIDSRSRSGAVVAGTPVVAIPPALLALFAAIMSGLYRRERTGEGCHVSTSLAANGVWANGMAIQGVIAGQNLGSRRQKR